ncbi:MAG: LapA family protein [Deltaproteobacteria bacterium]|nr:LapA family protein [Deltaproteobacteria bacterium]
MKRFLTRPRTIFWSLLTLLILIIIFQNVEPTQLNLLFWSMPEMPKLLLILSSMAAGSLLTILISWEIRRARRKKIEGGSPLGTPP